MAFVIALLTVVMVLDCIVLIFLVLIQLPKKDAGAGLAFGASATDALFGAGSGNVLTKITKYAAATFFGLAVLLSILQSSLSQSSGSRFRNAVSAPGTPATMLPASSQTAPAANVPGAPPATTPPVPASSNTSGLLSFTNIPAEATQPAPGVTVPSNAVPATPPK
jgi:preprotein translocase subunit SecG